MVVPVLSLLYRSVPDNDTMCHEDGPTNLKIDAWFQSRTHLLCLIKI